MYVDKPMRGHGLMQAIARVNRVFKDKPGGLVVDYLGLADELKRALATYTEAGGTGKTALDQAEAVALMLEKHEVCRGLFGSYATPSSVVRGLDWRLDDPRERPRAPARARPAHSPQARLPAGQAGEGDADRPGAGRSPVGDLGGGRLRQRSYAMAPACRSPAVVAAS
jgi:hypothetical protein